MRRFNWSAVVLALLLGLPAWGLQQQGDSQQKQQQIPEQEQQRQYERRPTLGPAPAPSLGGPRTSTTTDRHKLQRIRTLYVERIDNSLSDSLVVTLGRIGRIRIVANRKEADATLRGSCLESRRLKRLHSEVFISDRNGASVWQDNIYRPYNPPSLKKAVNDTAILIAQHLAESFNEVAR